MCSIVMVTLQNFQGFQSADFIGIDDGGTGAVTASGARTALGLEIGVDVQAYDGTTSFIWSNTNRRKLYCW